MAEKEIDLVDGAKSGWRFGEWIASAFFGLVQVAIRPLALLTQVFHRRLFGERYFTLFNLAVGLMLLALIYWIPQRVHLPISLSVLGYNFIASTELKQSPLLFSAAGRWLILAWGFSFVANYWRNSGELSKLYAKGERWHSRSSGVSWLPEDDNGVAGTVIFIVAIIIDLIGCSWVAILIVASLAASVGLDWTERMQMRQRVLDSIDSEIESKNLGEAIQKGLSPQQAEGLQVKLPYRLRATNSRAPNSWATQGHGEGATHNRVK